jgi:hypothetical protein
MRAKFTAKETRGAIHVSCGWFQCEPCVPERYTLGQSQLADVGVSSDECAKDHDPKTSCDGHFWRCGNALRLSSFCNMAARETFARRRSLREIVVGSCVRK